MTYYGGGGRVLPENDNAINKIEPIWTKTKLKIYGLQKQEP